jgi:hypothetical protein
MSPQDTALASVAAQCRTIIAAGHASCEDGANHIRQSKEAIARSLKLLSETRIN